MTKTQQEQEQFNKIQEAVLLKSDLKSIENKEIVRGKKQEISNQRHKRQP